MATLEPQRLREHQIQREVVARKNHRVLTHLTDAAHAIAPCPDNGSVYAPFTELASRFRSQNGRWPLWWEMAKMIYDSELEEGLRKAFF